MKLIALMLMLSVVSSIAKPSSALLNAIEMVESGCNEKAVGDNGRAVGCMQIWKIVVRDCNRIMGSEHFTYNDRLSRDKSKLMAHIYLSHYCGDDASYEAYALTWNMGPKGRFSVGEMKPYWIKVKRALYEEKR